MGKKKAFAGVKVATEGFAAGALAGMGLRMGLTPDRAGIYMFLVSNFCQATEGISPVLGYDCWMLYSIMIALAGAITAVSVLLIVRRAENIMKGLVIYGAGFITGMGLVLFS